MEYRVLARKWRPHGLSEMVGQEHIIRMLTNALESGRLHHAWLFTGTRGVGKTTLARILAKCLNCESGISAHPCDHCSACTSIDAGRFPDLIEVDAASRTKVEDTRDLLDSVQYAPTQGRFRICLIDEVHMLSGHSFNALLKTLEEPPAHVKFLLATTDPQKLPATVLSRCLQFCLHPVPAEKITQRLSFICEAENVSAELPALQLVAKAAKGSLRDALSLLDQAIAYCRNQITLADTRQMLGSSDSETLSQLLGALVHGDRQKLLKILALLAENAPDFDQLIADLLSLLHAISLQQVMKNPAAPTPVVHFAEKIQPEMLQLYYQMAIIARRDLPFTPSPADGFEMLVLRMLAFTPGLPEGQAASTTPHTTTIDTPSLTTPPAASPAPPQNGTDSGTQQPEDTGMPQPQEDWNQILSALKLSGMVLGLASHCTLTAIREGHITLSLAEKHAPLLNKKMTERIQQSLTTHFGKPVQLDILLAKENPNTPADLKKQTEARRQAEAAAILAQSRGVKEIMSVFDASLDMDSIEGN